jgi:hypothetical protein
LHYRSGAGHAFSVGTINHGGRTNATKLYYKFKPGEYGRYDDLISMYPYVQHSKSYPIGHPTKIFMPNYYDKNWFGVVKCKVSPPKNLYHPVLPEKVAIRGEQTSKNTAKLLFHLYSSCAKNQQQEKCNHSESERMITGTWSTEELIKAIEKGYHVEQIFEVWHFAKSDTLFKDYIKTFIKMKHKSSGLIKDETK